MSAPRRNSILIVGGGIAGLAMARALQPRGMTAQIVEQRTEPASGGLAINLPGNAITALNALGLGEEIANIGRPIRRREYRTHRDQLLFAIDEDAFWGPHARPRAVLRSDLTRLLSAGIAPDNLVNAKVTSINKVGDVLEVDTAEGDLFETNLLIGADGVHSEVRRALTGDGSTSETVLAAASWRFMVPNPGVDCWTVWVNRRGAILLMPVDETTVYGWAALTRNHIAKKSEFNAVADLADEFPALVQNAVSSALLAQTPIYHSPLEEVRLSRWSGNQIILIGDAAHATAPVWAQGAALALEDALALTWLISSMPDTDSVGSQYERLRRPRVEHVQTMTDRLSRAAHMPDWIRRVLMPILGPRSYRATYGLLRDDFVVHP